MRGFYDTDPDECCGRRKDRMRWRRMTKHFCDKCGKEVSAPTMWDIHCDARNTATYFHFEICSDCMLKVKNLFDSKAESEDKK